MNEIKIVVEKQDGVIGFNFDEIKEKLALKMKTYKEMVFAEDSKKDARSTVAELRKLKKSVNDKKIEVKKSFMLPYTEFEEKVKELDQLIDEPISYIGSQIEEFEKNRIEQRKSEILTLYSDAISDIEEFLPLNRIYNAKWENETTTLKSIQEEIETKVSNVKADLDTIRSIHTDAVEQAIDIYKTSLSIQEAIQYINRWEAQKAEILKKQEEQKLLEEQKKREAEERKLMEEQEKKETEEPKLPVQEPQKEIPEPKIVIVDKEPPEKVQASGSTLLYEIEADAFQIVQLEAAMREYGIHYRRV